MDETTQALHEADAFTDDVAAVLASLGTRGAGVPDLRAALWNSIHREGALPRPQRVFAVAALLELERRAEETDNGNRRRVARAINERAANWQRQADAATDPAHRAACALRASECRDIALAVEHGVRS